MKYILVFDSLQEWNFHLTRISTLYCLVCTSWNQRVSCIFNIWEEASSHHGLWRFRQSKVGVGITSMVKWGWMVSLSLKDGIQTLLSPGLIQSSMEVLSRPAAVEGCRLHPSQSGAVDHTCFHLLMPVGWHQVEHSFTTNQPHIGHLLVCHLVEGIEGMHSFVYAWLWLFDLWIEPTLLCKAGMSAKPLGLLASWYALSMCTQKLHSKMWSAFSNKT
jgi:hypothetical protein